MQATITAAEAAIAQVFFGEDQPAIGQQVIINPLLQLVHPSQSVWEAL